MTNETTLVSCTVVDVQPVNKGKLIALAAVDVEIDGIILRIDGVQVVRIPATSTRAEMTGVDVPRYRASDGTWRQAVQLPEEIRRPLGDAVLAECCDLGVTKRRYRAMSTWAFGQFG